MCFSKFTLGEFFFGEYKEIFDTKVRQKQLFQRCHEYYRREGSENVRKIEGHGKIVV
jgi:hypothetical protein